MGREGVEKKFTESLRQSPEQAGELKEQQDRFDEIYREYFPKLVSYVSARLNPRHVDSKREAEQIVQGLFLNYWNNKKILAPEANVLGMLYRGVKNAIINNNRDRTNHWQKLGEISAEDFVAKPDQSIEDRIDDAKIYRLCKKP